MTEQRRKNARSGECDSFREHLLYKSNLVENKFKITHCGSIRQHSVETQEHNDTQLADTKLLVDTGFERPKVPNKLKNTVLSVM